MTQKYQVKVSMKQAAIVETGIVLKQGDFGMQIEIEVLDFDATGTTPQIVFRKAMGAVESTTITVSGNKYTYTFKGTELDTPGKCFCDLKLKNSTTQRISTASFMFKVVADTLDGLTEETSSYSDTIEQIIEEAKSQFNYNIAPLYSASSTYKVGEYVIYNDRLYSCIVDILSPESWNSDHWGLRKAGDEIEKNKEVSILTGNDLFYSNTKIGLHYIPVAIGAGDKFDIETHGTAMSVSSVAYYGSNTLIDDFPSVPADSSAQITAVHEANYLRIYTNTNGGKVKISKVGGFGNTTIKNSTDIQTLNKNKVNISLAYGSNMFNYDTRLQNKDIISGTGAIVDSNTYFTSDKIEINPVYPLTIIGAYGTWAYCYDNTHYYGRIKCANGVVIANTYPNTNYIRITATNDVTEIMVGYGSNLKYVPYIPISNYIKLSNLVEENYGDYVNFFDKDQIINNKDIVSGTGEIIDSNVYYISAKIKMDFTKKIIISGAYGEWAYCYKDNNSYLGRINCRDGIILANTYAEIGYIRTTGIMPNINVIITYGNIAIPYEASEIDGYLKNEPLHLRIAQFNMGDFHGLNMSAGSDEMKAAMIELGSDVNANIYGLQYDTEYFGENLPIYESVLAYKKHYYSQYTGAYNGKGFLSDYQIYNVHRISYTNISNLSHPWFLVGDIRVGNRNIKLISLHVDWQDNDRRYAQLQQIRAYADNHEYCLIIGDFNPDDYINGVKQSDNMTTEHDLAIFKSDGHYASANAGYWGSYKTIVHSSMEGIIWDGDNILVTTANMEINNSRVVYRDWMDDHAILYADITIY